MPITSADSTTVLATTRTWIERRQTVRPRVHGADGGLASEPVERHGPA